MLAKRLLPSAKAVASLNGRACSRLYHDEHFKPPTMNDLPVPQGSWEEANNARQRRYNLHLFGGIGFALFSIAVAKSSGLFFFNFSAPARPAE